MKHTMKLRPNPFRMILCGEKTYELRLYDEKRQCIKIGDKIVFVNTKTDEPLVVSVKSIHIFKNFTELYQALPLLKCGYTEEILQLLIQQIWRNIIQKNNRCSMVLWRLK